MADANDCERDDPGDEGRDWYLKMVRYQAAGIADYLGGAFNGYGLKDNDLRSARASLDFLLKFLCDVEIVIKDQSAVDANRAWFRYRALCEARKVEPNVRYSDDEYESFRARTIPLRCLFPNWRGNKKLRAEVAELFSDKPDA